MVRVNDRGPYTKGRIIDLSKAAADRLNLSNNTKVKVDFINVAPDGTLSGPGTIGTIVAKQSYALPARPDPAPAAWAPRSNRTPVASGAAVRLIDNSSLRTDDNNASAAGGNATGGRSGFLGAKRRTGRRAGRIRT